MTKNVCRFDMSYFATSKSEEDRRTLSEHGYRVLIPEEAIECIKRSENMTAGDLDIERLPVLLAKGFIELRYYKKDVKEIGNEEGNRIFAYFKKVGRILPIALIDEEEAKALSGISENEERKRSTR